MEKNELVAVLIAKNKKALAEIRKKSDDFGTGLIWIPGGHIEKGETPHKAILREMKEEFDIKPTKPFFLCKLPWKHKRKKYLIHYFVCTKWKGKIQNKEAAKLIWISLKNLSKLTEEIDRNVTGIYLSNWRKLDG